jgi:Prefoldin subunit
VFAKAKVPPARAVALWLGADIMLEHPLEEAATRLANTIGSVETELKDNKELWGKLCECKTTTEVNISRLHNFDVERKKQRKALKRISE